MAKSAMTFQGGKDLATALGKLSTRLSKTIQLGALREAAEPMRKAMGHNAPYEPGKPDLRDTMTISTSRGEDSRESAVAVGPSEAGFYGSFQERGTAHHAAQPFARPAFDETNDQCLQVLGTVLWRELAGRGISRPMAVVDVPVEGEV